jgi:hypothetical protein
MGKFEGKGRLGRFCIRLEDNFKVDLIDIGWGGLGLGSSSPWLGTSGPSMFY